MKRKITSIKWGALLFFISLSNAAIAQKFVNSEFYWPSKAPNGVTRNSPDETSEDWWFDIKAVPSTHPAFSSGKFIACGYSNFDEVNLQLVSTGDPCYSYTGNDLSTPSPGNIADEFELPDMKHGNSSGTIGLINITPTHSANENPNSWINNYGLGCSFFKVIPTSDSCFLAVGICDALKTNGPIAVVNNDPDLPSIRYQSLTSSGVFNFGSSCSLPSNSNDPPNSVKKHRHACLLKVNQFGEILWYYKYGAVPFNTPNNEAYFNGSYGTDVIEVSGGNYIMIGGLSDNPANGNYGGTAFIAKVNSVGTLVWMKEFKENSPYDINRFTAITTKVSGGVPYAYVTGERTTTKMSETPTGMSDPGTYSPTSPGSTAWNGTVDPNAFQFQQMLFEPFVRKINLNTQTESWVLNGPQLSGDLTKSHRCRSIVFDASGSLLVGVSSTCFLDFGNGECINNVVSKVNDNGASASVTQTINFGPLRAYDLSKGLAISPTTDNGFLVVGTKKTHTINIEQNYSIAPFGLGYNMLNGGETNKYAQTDAFIAKCNASGIVEWTTIFDNSSVSPGGNYLSNAGNPINQSNINTWMNLTTTRSKKDIKRQECVYAITNSQSPEGNVIVAGNNSSNIDDSYVAMVQNTCQLTLSNHLIQAFPGIVDPSTNITMMQNFIAPTISTGRISGNTDGIAKFTVNNKAVVKIEAGQVVDMFEGSDIGFVNTTETPSAIAEADVDIFINAIHTCTSGPLYRYSVPTGTNNGQVGRPSSPAVINEINKANDKISITPNPSSGIFTLSLPTTKFQQIAIQIVDIRGRILKNLKITNSDVDQKRTWTFSITDLPTGIYNCRVIIDKGVSVNNIKLLKE